MAEIRLGYGREKLLTAFDETRFDVLAGEDAKAAMSDAEINAALDAPVDSDLLENLIDAGDTVLIVVPDATRNSASASIVNLTVRRLIANGTMPFDIRIIFATGIHRGVTDDEKRTLVTPFIFQRVKTLDHNARDLVQIVDLGMTQRGTPIQLNRALLEHDKIIIIGGVEFHYFAGFGGGRKLICPGLASSRTINETHKLAFDFERRTRRENVRIGSLANNPVHHEFIEIAAKINPTFGVNAITDDAGNAVAIFAGNWRAAHERACEFFAATHTIKIAEKREIVIVSCGGTPFDANLIQAHKALETASHACTEGGTIIWLAKCAEGLGRADFLEWFAAEDSRQLAENLRQKFQVNGQTAWSLLDKAERFKIHLISNLPEETARRMRLQPATNIAEILARHYAQKGFILPFGAKFLPISEKK